MGISNEKLRALNHYRDSPLFDAREITALAYADAMTATGSSASDELFARVREHFNDEEIVELTAIIAWENASARFNRALGIESQHLWKR